MRYDMSILHVPDTPRGGAAIDCAQALIGGRREGSGRKEIGVQPAKVAGTETVMQAERCRPWAGRTRAMDATTAMRGVQDGVQRFGLARVGGHRHRSGVVRVGGRGVPDGVGSAAAAMRRVVRRAGARDHGLQQQHGRQQHGQRAP